MNDIQKGADNRGVALTQVGIRNYRRPILIAETRLATVGHFSLATTLAANIRGTHMSRLAKIIEQFSEWDLDIAQMAAKEAANALAAQSAILTSRFEYFYETQAPVSKEKSLMPANVEIKTLSSGAHELTLAVQVATACPCSKSIAEYGAHNQRATVTVSGQLNGPILPIIQIIEQCSSVPLYGVLKRADEKQVTEQAYENAKLVEDVVRDSVLAFANHSGFTLSTIDVENDESIHAHNAFAQTSL